MMSVDSPTTNQKADPVYTADKFFIRLNNMNYIFSSCASTKPAKLDMLGYLKAYDSLSWVAIVSLCVLLIMPSTLLESVKKETILQATSRLALMLLDAYPRPKNNVILTDFISLIFGIFVTNWYKTFLTDSTTVPFYNYPPADLDEIVSSGIEVNYLPYVDFVLDREVYSNSIPIPGPLPMSLTKFRPSVSLMDDKLLEKFNQEFRIPSLNLYYPQRVCNSPSTFNMTQKYITYNNWRNICLHIKKTGIAMKELPNADFPDTVRAKKTVKLFSFSKHSELKDTVTKYENCENAIVFEDQALSMHRQKFAKKSHVTRQDYVEGRETVYTEQRHVRLPLWDMSSLWRTCCGPLHGE